jgi:hypothetical protein
MKKRFGWELKKLDDGRKSVTEEMITSREGE